MAESMKKYLLLVCAGFVPASVVAIGANLVQAAPPANTNNVTICHRTASTTNPYVKITVDQRSVGNANSKHGGGAHDHWATSVYQTKPNPNVYDPSKTYPANDKKWGDIIAFTDVSGNALTGTAANVAGLNNTGIGAAIFNGTGAYAGLCVARGPRDYYEIQRAAGVPPTDILKEMDELDSPEFASQLTACGGSFVGCNPELLGTPTVTTVPSTVTTIPTPATLPPGTTLAAGKGAVTVKIWIDKNRDGSKASDEKNMANITVKIQGPNGVTKSAKTDSNGDVTFLNLDPGSWSVVSVLSVDGYEKVYDADGSVNWATTLNVVAGEVSQTSFAAAAVASTPNTLPATGNSMSWFAAIAAVLILSGLVMRKRLFS